MTYRTDPKNGRQNFPFGLRLHAPAANSEEKNAITELEDEIDQEEVNPPGLCAGARCELFRHFVTAKKYRKKGQKLRFHAIRGSPIFPQRKCRIRRIAAGQDRSVPKLRQANHCIGCGLCKPECPHSIDIRRSGTMHRLRRLRESPSVAAF